MIRNQWYVVLQARELKKGKILGATRMGEKMVFWRDASNMPVCQADFCPHRGVALRIGKLKDNHIQCPFHGFEYDATGKCVVVPANGKVSEPPKALKVVTYPAREAHGYIYIWWGDEQHSYPKLPWYDDLDDSFATSDLVDHWTVDYSRAIENQLDVFHIPFVHADSIGRGNRTVADGPLAELKEDTLEIWVYNRMDDGVSTAKRSSELIKPARSPFLKFRFPNLWMNRISEDVLITAFFTPIDNENCLIYLRGYQRFLKVPILRQLAAWTFNPANRYILNQDKRVVLTQYPKKTGMKIGEILVPADGPIILYRKTREALQKRSE